MDWDKSFEDSFNKIMTENNNVTVRVDGKPFRCRCGCNVFQHPEGEPNIYACNACDTWYEGSDD